MTALPMTRSGARRAWSSLDPKTKTPSVSLAAWKTPRAAASALWWNMSTPTRIRARAASRPAAASSKLLR